MKTGSAIITSAAAVENRIDFERPKKILLRCIPGRVCINVFTWCPLKSRERAKHHRDQLLQRAFALQRAAAAGETLNVLGFKDRSDCLCLMD